jgi:hypothetical protein
LPIKRIDKNFEKSILDILEMIEKLTKDSDYRRDTSVTSALEALMAKIDQIIYAAYELNDEEVALVEDF